MAGLTKQPVQLLEISMNIKLCAFALAALAVSCGSGTTAPELKSPQGYEMLMDENHTWMGLRWQNEPGVDGYLVSINIGDNDDEYTYTVAEPRIIFDETIGAFDPAKTYYITVQTERSTAISTPPYLVIIEGGTMSFVGVMTSGIPVNEKPNNPTTPKDDEPLFDITVFEAERAAWEAQRLTHYRFTRRLQRMRPLPDLTFKVTPGREPELIQPIGDEQWLPSEAETFGRTIDEVYADILEHSTPPEKPSVVEDIIVLIRYNTEYHYPEWFEFRIIFSPDYTGGGGSYGFEVIDFEAGQDGF
jgi:hypothetical protein